MSYLFIYCSLYDHQLSNIIDWNQTKDVNIKVEIRKRPLDLSKCIMTLHNQLKAESPNSCCHKHGDKVKCLH